VFKLAEGDSGSEAKNKVLALAGSLAPGASGGSSGQKRGASVQRNNQSVSIVPRRSSSGSNPLVQGSQAAIEMEQL